MSIKVVVMRRLYTALCVALPALGYKRVGVTKCGLNFPCAACCFCSKYTWSGVEAITRVALGDRLFFYAILQRDVYTDKFILLANLLATLASLLNASQSSRAVFHLGAVIIAIMILSTFVVLNSVLAKLVW
jgi:hypothetical protein